MAPSATIDLNILQAVSLFASAQETRYYLMGVCLEIDATSVTYVATDGHRLFAYRKAQFNTPDNTLLGTFIIPIEECKPFKRGKRSEVSAKLSAEGDGPLRFDYDGYAKIFNPIDGVFPDWRRVVSLAEPKASGSILCFNWSYVASFQKAAETINLGKVSILPGGEGAAIMHFDCGHDVFGLVMPIRSPNMPKIVVPAWVVPPAPPEEHSAEQAA